MELNSIFSIMNKKEYYYFTGNSNDRGELVLDFSVLYNGRGRSVEILITDNKHGLMKNEKAYTNLSDSELLLMLEEL